MLILAILSFLLAACVGLYLLSYVLNNKNTPKGVALIHGSLGATGILLLLCYSLFYSAPIGSLLLFILAATGGFFIFFRDILGHKIPSWMALGHGLVAIIAFVLLLGFYFSH